jgi:hypothetical protein
LGFSGRLSRRQKTAVLILMACVNLAIFVVLGRVVYALLVGENRDLVPVVLSRPERSPTVPVPLAYPPTWTVTPTSTALPTRLPTSTSFPTPTRTPTLYPTRTPVLLQLTMPLSISAEEESNRQARIKIVEAAADAYHDKFPAAVLLGIAALESQGSYSNRVADHGVMGVTPKAGRCYTLVYRDTAFDLRQNVSDAACHLNGYAWERANSRDRNTVLIKNAIRNAGYSDYMGQVVAAVHWYAGETQPGYLSVLADIIDGNVDAARSVPDTFGRRYRNPSLARALRIAYHALIGRD